jgi:hypothetical protein
VWGSGVLPLLRWHVRGARGNATTDSYQWSIRALSDCITHQKLMKRAERKRGLTGVRPAGPMSQRRMVRRFAPFNVMPATSQSDICQQSHTSTASHRARCHGR